MFARPVRGALTTEDAKDTKENPSECQKKSSLPLDGGGNPRLNIVSRFSFVSFASSVVEVFTTQARRRWG